MHWYGSRDRAAVGVSRASCREMDCSGCGIPICPGATVTSDPLRYSHAVDLTTDLSLTEMSASKMRNCNGYQTRGVDTGPSTARAGGGGCLP